jgi:HK97 family phage major capsid protein
MNTLTMLREKRTERKNVTDAAQAILTKCYKGNKRALTTEEDTEFNKRHEEGDRLYKEIERLEKQHDAESQLNAAATDTRSAGRENFSGDLPESEEMPDGYVEKKKELQEIEFRRWICKGVLDEMPKSVMSRRAKIVAEIGPYFRSEMRALSNDSSLDIRGQQSYRALSAITGTAGADTVPISFMYQLEVATKYFGGIVNAADYVDTDDGRQLPWPTLNDTTNTGETILENTQVAGSTGGASEQDPAYGVVPLNAYMHDTGFVLIPLQLIQDSAFNVDTYLNEALDTRLGRRMNTECTVGTGASANSATGFLTVTTQGAVSTTGAGLVWNDLVNLFHSVDPSYRARPKSGWQLADSTVAVLRKLVDSNGRPLWIAGGTTGNAVASGAPGLIMDAPYWVNQDMPSLAIGNKAIAYGDWSKYKIRRVKSIMMVTAKERFIDKLQVGMIAWLRFDGNLIDAGTHPIKYLQQAAS